MGERGRKSRHRDVILGAESRCVYCPRKPTTIEHMPPTGMFRERLRLSGLEFASCEICNQATRGADAVAAFMARMSTSNDLNDWRHKEAKKLIGGIAQLAPEVISELFGGRNSRFTWVKQASGLLEKARLIEADGPVLKALMTVFAAKLGMALYREHIGVPLPLEGGVYTQVYFNRGLNDEASAEMLKILPLGSTLRMGKSHSTTQFAYRFNSDDKEIFAALIGFHSALHIRVVVAANPEPYQFMLGEYNADFVKPGELEARSPKILREPKR